MSRLFLIVALFTWFIWVIFIALITFIPDYSMDYFMCWMIGAGIVLAMIFIGYFLFKAIE